jgi:glycosyltransferase involved in cell wall biosynthesis
MNSIAGNNPAVSDRPAAFPQSGQPIAPGSRKPRVSVVIPTFNSSAMVKEAIQSVLSQTYRDFEVVVIDDGSTDNTEAVVRGFGEPVRYFKQKNQGVSAARNAGIQQSLGEYIAFLDSDDLWLPEKLAEEIPALDDDPKIGLVYCDWSVTSGDAVLQSSYLKDLPAASGYVFDDLIQSGFILTSGVVVRRACLDNVGDFDKSLAIAQDYDLWLRISYQWKAQLVNQRLFTKRSWDGSLSSNLIKTALERIALFQKTLRDIPGMTSRSRRLVRHQLALNHWDVGYDQFDSLSFKAARRNFVSSLKYDCTNGKALVYLAATYLPTSLVRAAKAAKRANP